MTYTAADLQRDLAEIASMSVGPKPTDPIPMVLWEMSRTHLALMKNWIQIYKPEFQQFHTSAPIDDTENYIGFALAWISIVYAHHQLEDEVQFPVWSKYVDMSANEAEHEKMLPPLREFEAYLKSVLAGDFTWDASKAEALAQEFFPPLAHHYVAELYTLTPEVLIKGGYTPEESAATFAKVAMRGKEILDPARDVVPLLLHNDGATDFPPVPWTITKEWKMPQELYDAHKGWWKYAPPQ
ncbi:hypothetical protein BOTBODRAFT_145115 [Botryobasidium botryosum FD-172 SS1]|uniref:Hemerythrin-like domain-containing protein n=1 Tax=Botryobasidium botryosum (strain FD-172 SS1) TaxID=930990 RepID=A0A067MHX3_BOTB1|nr:hypothetical protein BOTBODRAFT_145115 [Botryobasidium botryosum FD-172 SS1]